MKSKIIAVQEELLQKSEWEFFLKSSSIRVIVLSRRQMTLEVSKSVHDRYGSYNNFMALNCVPSGFYPRQYDVYLFAPQNFQEAKDFSIRNPKAKVIVITTPELELNFEDAGNFSVRTWQYMSSYINELKDVKPKEQKQKVEQVKKIPIQDRPIPDQKIRRWSEPEQNVEKDYSIMPDDEFQQGNESDEPRVY